MRASPFHPTMVRTSQAKIVSWFQIECIACKWRAWQESSALESFDCKWQLNVANLTYLFGTLRRKWSDLHCHLSCGERHGGQLCRRSCQQQIRPRRKELHQVRLHTCPADMSATQQMLTSSHACALFVSAKKVKFSCADCHTMCAAVCTPWT